MQVVIDGLLTKYSRQGKGNGILLLHGWGTNSTSFSNLSSDLVKEYEVVSVDFPGFGGSQTPPKDWSVEDYVRFTSKFLQKITFQPAIIVAHSFGGRVAIKGISEKALKTEKLILIGSAGIKPEKNFKQKAILQGVKAGKNVARLPGLSRLQNKIKQKISSEDYLNAGEMKQIFLNTINEDLQEDAEKITVSTLLIWGENDDSTPIKDAKKFHELIKNSQLEILPNAGHFVHQDKPDEVSKMVNEFIT